MASRIITDKRLQKDSRTDHELMTDLCNGDETAFSEIIRRFQAPIYSHLIRMLANEDDAGEILQETFCRVYRYRDNFNHAYKLVTWIFTIASNLAKKEWRRRQRWRTIPLDATFPLTAKANLAPHYNAGRIELSSSIEDAINLLPPHYREPFILREKQGLSYDDIAEILGIKLGTVKSRINRARRQLQKLLGDVWEEWK